MPKRYDAGEVITAMVTPMDKNRDVDYEGVEKLATHLAANGSDSILITATTGESPTLTFDEEFEILSTVKRAVKNKTNIIMSTGSNSTDTAISSSKRAEREGADALLCVVPYYNKPSQEGMIAHFSAIAECTNLPVFIYNIPSRTGVNIKVETVKFLAEKYQNIVAIKQSFPDMDAITEMKMQCPSDFSIFSGDDSLTLPMLSLGAEGVVSVASHIYGKELKSMIHNFKSGEIHAAANMHRKLYPIFKNLFMAPNPVPVKAVLEHFGIVKEYVRKPLIELTSKQKEALFDIIDGYDKD